MFQYRLQRHSFTAHLLLIFTLFLGSGSLFAAAQNERQEEINQLISIVSKNKIHPTLTADQIQANKEVKSLAPNALPLFISSQYLLERYNKGKPFGERDLPYFIKKIANYSHLFKNFKREDEDFIKLLQAEIFDPLALLHAEIPKNDEELKKLQPLKKISLFKYTITLEIGPEIHYPKGTNLFRALLAFYLNASEKKEEKQRKFNHQNPSLLEEEFVHLLFDFMIKNVTHKNFYLIIYALNANVKNSSHLIAYYALKNPKWVRSLRKALEKNNRVYYFSTEENIFSPLLEGDLVDELYKLSKEVTKIEEWEKEILQLQKEKSPLEKEKTTLEKEKITLEKESKEEIKAINHDPKGVEKEIKKITQKIKKITAKIDHLVRLKKKFGYAINRMKELINMYDIEFLPGFLMPSHKWVLNPESEYEFFNSHYLLEKYNKKIAQAKTTALTEQMQSKKLNNIMGIMQNYFADNSKKEGAIMPWTIIQQLERIGKVPEYKRLTISANEKIFHILTEKNAIANFNLFCNAYNKNKTPEEQKSSLELLSQFIDWFNGLEKAKRDHFITYTSFPSHYQLLIKDMLAQKEDKNIPDNAYALKAPMPQLIMHLSLLSQQKRPKDILLTLFHQNYKNLQQLLDWRAYRQDSLFTTKIDAIIKEIKDNPKKNKKWQKAIQTIKKDFTEKGWIDNPDSYTPIPGKIDKEKEEILKLRLKNLNNAFFKYKDVGEAPDLALTYQNKDGKDLLLLAAKAKVPFETFKELCDIYQAKYNLWERYEAKNNNAPNPLLMGILYDKKSKKYFTTKEQNKKYTLIKNIFQEQKNSHSFYHYIKSYFYKGHAPKRTTWILPRNQYRLQGEQSALFFDTLPKDNISNEAKFEKVKAHFTTFFSSQDVPKKKLTPIFYNTLMQGDSFRSHLFQKITISKEQKTYLALLEDTFTTDWQKTYNKNYKLSPLHWAISTKDFSTFQHFWQKYTVYKDFKAYVDSYAVRLKKGNQPQKKDADCRYTDSFYNLYFYTTLFGTEEMLKFLIDKGKNLIPTPTNDAKIFTSKGFTDLLGYYTKSTDPIVKKLTMYNDLLVALDRTPLFLLLGNFSQYHNVKILETLTPLKTFAQSPYYKALKSIFEAPKKGKKNKILAQIKKLKAQKLTSMQKEQLMATLFVYDDLSDPIVKVIKNHPKANIFKTLITALGLEKTNTFTLFLKYENSQFLQNNLYTRASILGYLADTFPQYQHPYTPYQQRYFFEKITSSDTFLKYRRVNKPLIDIIYSHKKHFTKLEDTLHYFQEEQWQPNAITTLFEKETAFLSTLIQKRILLTDESGYRYEILKKKKPLNLRKDRLWFSSGFLNSLAKYGSLQNVETFFDLLKSFGNDSTKDIRSTLKYNYNPKLSSQFISMLHATLQHKREEEGKRIFSYLLGENANVNDPLATLRINQKDINETFTTPSEKEKLKRFKAYYVTNKERYIRKTKPETIATKVRKEVNDATDYITLKMETIFVHDNPLVTVGITLCLLFFCAIISGIIYGAYKLLRKAYHRFLKPYPTKKKQRKLLKKSKNPNKKRTKRKKASSKVHKAQALKKTRSLPQR